MTTRKAYAGVLLAVLVLTAGCSGFLGENQSFEASEATVSDDALSETGYESTGQNEYQFEETFGNDTEVSITSRISGYDKEYGNGSGYFIALSSPKSDIAGLGDVNPIGDYDKKKLIAEAVSRSDVDVEVDEDDIESVDNATVTVLDTEATVSTYNATVDRSGSAREMRIRTTRIEHGDDHVVAVGVYPETADAGRSDITTLIEGIEHDAGE